MRYVKINGGTAVIKVEGRYDLCNTLEVMAELNTAFLSGCTKVRVDFTQTTEMDSAAMKDLQKIRNRVRVENFSGFGATGEVSEKLKQAQIVG